MVGMRVTVGLILALLMLGCNLYPPKDLLAPKFGKLSPPGNKAWTAVATCEVMHKEFGNVQRCMSDNNIPFTSDYFDDDEPQNKNIVLRVEKSKVEEARKLLKDDAAKYHYTIFSTKPVEVSIEPK